MADVELKNTPSLTAWILALAAGLVAFGIAKVIGSMDWTPSVFLAVLVALAVGIFLTIAWGGSAASESSSQSVSKAVPSPAPAAAAPVAAAPAAAVMSEPAAAAPAATAPAAAVMSAPVAEPEPKAKAAPVKKPAAAKKAAPAAKAAPAKKEAAAKKPAKAKAAEAEPAAPGEPVRLKGPRGGKADDLKEIEGIGPALEKLVNSLGFYHFDQIANWSEADVAWVDENMKSFKGRIARDKWVAQAKIIVTEGLEAFRVRAKTNDY